MSEAINMDIVEELLSLSDQGDPELLIDLIQMYLQDSPNKLAEINAGLEAQDYERVERAAHSLKGSAGNLGAVLVQRDCDQLQQASRRHELDAIRTGVSDLALHFDDAKRALQALLDKYV